MPFLTEPTEAECFEAEQELLFDVHFRQLDREIRECGLRQNQKQRKTMKQIPVSDLNTDNYTQILHEDDPKPNAPHHFEIKRKVDGETIAKNRYARRANS